MIGRFAGKAGRGGLSWRCAIRLHSVPARYRENSANIPRRLRELPFSVLSGFVRLSQHTQECKTQSQLSWRTCASLPEALPSHRPGLISLVRLARVEKPLLLRACSYSLTTPLIVVMG